MKKLIVKHPWLTLLGTAWCILLLSQEHVWSLVVNDGAFLFLGVVGAIFANSTGAGGGVVFVPFFQQMAFTPVTVVATSFAIQCCGMLAGALSWYQYYHNTQRHVPDWFPLQSILKISIPAGWLGIWSAQYGVESLIPSLGFDAVGNQLHVGFGIFSIFLALALLASIKILNDKNARTSLAQSDKYLLLLVSYAGGLITAYLSVGIGELVAILLIVRGFSVTVSIGVAVILSATAVWGGVTHHIWVTEAINWSVVLFAGAGAVIGGRIARYLVMIFSPRQLKVFFAVWVLILGMLSLL